MMNNCRLINSLTFSLFFSATLIASVPTLGVEPDQDEAVRSALQMGHARYVTDLTQQLDSHLDYQAGLEPSLRRLLTIRATDLETSKLQHVAARTLGRNHTEPNLQALITSIDLMAARPGPTSGVGTSPFEHRFICVRSLIRHGGEDAVRLVIDEVCGKHWSNVDQERAQLQLELLAYTVLRIRDPDHYSNPDPGFELVRQQLVGEVQQECMDTDHEDKKIVTRFIELLQSVEPRTYLWPPSAEREVDLDEHPLPENSRILRWDEKNKRLIYLPEAAMEKQLGIGTAPGS